jgi:hypothetical protein
MWTWSGDKENEQTRTEVFRRYESETMVLHVTTNKYDRTRIRNRDGNQMYDVKRSGDITNMKNPHSGLLSFPLSIGKDWRITCTTAQARHDAHYRVVGYEPVTTPAGTFDAFKIEGLDKRNDRPLGINVTMWYAPSVKNIVQLIGREEGNNNPVPGWNYELSAYTLSQ